MPDIQQLFHLGQQMQGRLQQLQTELGERIVEAGAGGDMVRVSVDGRGALRSLHIDPEVFQGRDAEFLAELVLSAVAEAQRRAGQMLQDEMRRMQGLPQGTPTP